MSKTTRNLGTPLRELKLKKGVLVAVIVRKDQVIIPEGSASIQEGDSVIIISKGHTILDVNDIYEASFLDGGGSDEF